MEDPVPERQLCIHENLPHDVYPYPCPYGLNPICLAQEDASQYIDLNHIFEFPDVIVSASDDDVLLCNPKFICKNNWYFGLSPTYFLYPLASLPKMVKQEMPASIEQS